MSAHATSVAVDRGVEGRGGSVLLAALVVLQIPVDPEGHQAAGDQNDQQDAQPPNGSEIPCGLARDGGGRGFDDGEGCAGGEDQFEIPGREIEMIRAADLAPQK
jgi:hypothetical protein